MPVSNLSVVPVSAKVIAPELQMPKSVKKNSLKVYSFRRSSVNLIKEIVKNGSLKLPVLSNIFPVHFIYRRKVVGTKIMKVGYLYNNAFYKVALTTLMHKSASLWWLQFQPKGWVVLLGPKLGEKLKWAIISAIEGHELQFSIQKLTEL